MRTALICHEDNVLNTTVLPAFLSSFSELVGVVVIEERAARKRRRLRFEVRRSRWRIADVLAFRVLYRLRWAARDREWVDETARRLTDRYPPTAATPVHHTVDPNSEATRRFLESVAPDLTLARCKTLLRREVFAIAPTGTFVLHPGICPEYRNAHGCFWALARRDLGRCGATVLRIDEGVDTGPIHGYLYSDIDELGDSHVVIEHRVVFDNLDRVAAILQDAHAGRAAIIDVSGRESAAWGQPRLTDYLRWKRAARRTR